MRARGLLAPLVLVALAAPGESAQDAPSFDLVIELELAGDGAPPDGGGPCHRVRHEVPFSGTLHAWAKSDSCELLLRVERANGSVLAQDADRREGSPYVRIEVELGDALEFVVCAFDAVPRARCALHLVAAPESAATRAEAARTDDSIQERIARLANASAGTGSELLHAALWAAAADAARVGDGASYLRALELVHEHRLRTLPDEHPALQRVRNALGLVRWSSGEIEAARALFERAVVAMESTCPDDDPYLNTSRDRLAVTLHDLGQLERARDLQEHVFAVRSRTLAEDDPVVIAAAQNLADTLRSSGELARARSLQEHVHEVCSRTLPDDAPALQLARQNLAITLKQQGEWSRARDLEERVLQVRARTLPEDDLELASARSNLAITLAELGDLAAARPLFEQALEVRSRRLPDDHLDLLRARQNLAGLLYQLGDLAGARPLFESAVESLERNFPEEHPDVQGARANLAATLRGLGEIESSRARLEAVERKLTETLPAEHPLLWTARANFAIALRDSGELERARDLLQGVVDATTHSLPADDAALLAARRNLAWTVFALGDGEQLVREAAQLAAGSQAAVDALVLQLSPREVEAHVHTLARANASSVLEFALGRGPISASEALDRQAFALVETLRSAGRTAAALLASPEARDPSSLARRDAVRARSADVARLVQSSASRDELARAVAARDEAQRALATSLSHGDRARELLLEPDVARLSARLGAEQVLVGYWSYERDLDGAAGSALLAFVVRPDGGFARVELGAIRPIEQDVEAWRAALGGPGERGVAVTSAGEGSEDQLRELGTALRRRIFDPLRGELRGAREIVLAVDDVLHMLPLDALPDGELLLGERFAMHFRSTLRELAWSGVPVSEAGDAVVLGGVAYDADSPVSETRRGAIGMSFEPLPATRLEASGIAELHRASRRPGTETVLLVGADASRAAVERLAPNARVLHLATHGWFVPHPEASSRLQRAAEPTSDREGAAASREQVEHASPMTLCGLALAGANADMDARGDRGLVTAEELASWDLSGCELAVLSACDTHLGIRQAGQGVASLQKALQMAGARSVITSLWNVPDEATKELMLDFYRRLWVEKKPKHQALWEAKTKLREAKDERGAPKYTTRDWAAWVLTGDPH